MIFSLWGTDKLLKDISVDIWVVMKMEIEETYDLSYAKRAVAVLVLLPLIVMYTEAVLIPSLPTIQKEFGITPGDASWILSIYLLVGTVSVAIMGKLGDMYGKKKMFITALSFYTAGVILNGFAPSYEWLLFSRGMQGIGMAIFPLGFSLVREEFPPEMVPEVQGMISAMFAVGMVIALPLGAYISQNYGWRWTYHSVVPFAILMLILSVLILRESRYITPGKLDIGGILLLMAFVVPAIVAVTKAPTVGWKNTQTIGLLGISALAFVLLIFYEKRVENPLIPISVISSRNPMIANLGIMMAGFGIQMMNQANTYILQMPEPYGFGKTILQSGLLMTPNAMVMLVVAPLTGKLMVKFGVRIFATLGAVIGGIGLMLLAKFATSSSLPGFIALIVLTGIGITLMNVSLINVLIFSVDRRVMGVATGANSLFRSFGSTWGPAIAGTVMTTYSRIITIPANPPMHFMIPTDKAYEVLFSSSAAVFFLLFLISFGIKEVFKGGFEKGGMYKSATVEDAL